MKQNWKSWLPLGGMLFALYLAIHYWTPFCRLAQLGLQAAAPLLLGAVMAYAVNILMSMLESRLFPRGGGLSRPVSLVLAYASLAAILALVVRMVLPELVQCVGLLAQQAAPVVEQLNQTLLDRNLGLDQILESYGASLADGSVDWRQALETVGKWLSQSLSGVMGSMLNLLSSAVSTAFNLLVSFIFSIYLLMGKERLGSQCARVLRTYLPERWYGGAMYVLNTVNGCFRRFVVGQCTEAVILGLLCMAGMLLLGFPYATMVGTLIGFTALIPVAGAYIGAGVGAFMIFTVSPVKALLFLLFIAVLQQLEGNLIYPRVVGASIGLPGVWVLAAVTVGGGVLGVAGMLLAVPLAAAAYQMLREDVRHRNLPAEEPPETER